MVDSLDNTEFSKLQLIAKIRSRVFFMSNYQCRSRTGNENQSHYWYIKKPLIAGTKNYNYYR